MQKHVTNNYSLLSKSSILRKWTRNSDNLSCYFQSTSRFRSKKKTINSNNDNQSFNKNGNKSSCRDSKIVSNSDQTLSNDNDLAILASRIIAGFGVLHIVSQFCFEMTQCEGPSMLPTINPFGEIILIEKITHRLYGLDGGDDEEIRTKSAITKQLEWEQKESKMWLAGKYRHSNKTMSNTNSLSSQEKSDLTSTHTWYDSRQKEVNDANYFELSSWSKCLEKLKTGVCIGDVVVLKHPDKDGTVCKRVLGLPGDTIIRTKKDSPFSGKGDGDLMPFSHNDVNAMMWRVSIDRLTCLRNSSLTVVPSGHIWVEGDNSSNSSDSKNYGPVPASLIVGKVWMRLWPLRKSALSARGGPPILPGISSVRSIHLPAGYQGERIVK